MADVDLTAGGVAGSLPAGPAHKLARLQMKLDFTSATGTNRDANDVLQLFNVAFCEVIHACINVTVAEGGTATADLGDGSDVDGFIDGADLNAVGLTRMVLALTEAAPNTITGYSSGKLYGSTVDTIDLKVLNDMDAAVCYVMVDVIDYRVDDSA
jgi:hypothetical protein